MSAKRLWAALALILLAALPLRAEEMVVAVIKSRDIAPYNLAVKGFEEHLKRNGMNPWLVPFVLDAGGTNPESLVEEVRRKKPALILTLGTKATEAAAASIDDLPIVYGILLNPGPMITRSRNVTGVLMDIPFDAQFEVLRSIIPGARVIGFLYSDPETAAVVMDAEAAALRLGLKVLALPVRSERDIPDQLRKLKGKADVLWMIADGTVYTPRSTEFILQETLKRQIPFVGLSARYVKAGALFAISWDYADMGVQAAELAHRVLTGTPPSEIPAATPRRLPLEVNLRSAKTLGIKVPRRIIDQAEEVYE